MTVLRSLLNLRQPLAALALCAMLAQTVVGFALTASPALAGQSGLSLCQNSQQGVPGETDDQQQGAGFCACVLTLAQALVPQHDTLPLPQAVQTLCEPPFIGEAFGRAPSNPPPARAPPPFLHS